MIPMGGAKPDTRAVVEPQTTPFGLLWRHFQARLTPDAFHPFMVHTPALTVQQRSNSRRAVTAVQRGQFDDPLGQQRLVIPNLGQVTLGGAGLAQDLAGPPLRRPQSPLGMAYRLTTSVRAQ